MKECSECGKIKKENEFYITSSYKGKDYRDSMCGSCRQYLRKHGEPTKEEKIKKWNKKFKELWKNERTL